MHGSHEYHKGFTNKFELHDTHLALTDTISTKVSN